MKLPLFGHKSRQSPRYLLILKSEPPSIDMQRCHNYSPLWRGTRGISTGLPRSETQLGGPVDAHVRADDVICRLLRSENPVVSAFCHGRWRYLQITMVWKPRGLCILSRQMTLPADYYGLKTPWSLHFVTADDVICRLLRSENNVKPMSSCYSLMARNTCWEVPRTGFRYSTDSPDSGTRRSLKSTSARKVCSVLSTAYVWYKNSHLFLSIFLLSAVHGPAQSSLLDQLDTAIMGVVVTITRHP
jgi:hypothetical protein